MLIINGIVLFLEYHIFRVYIGDYDTTPKSTLKIIPKPTL